jgi:hypothetical protein
MHLRANPFHAYRLEQSYHPDFSFYSANTQAKFVCRIIKKTISTAKGSSMQKNLTELITEPYK